MNPYWQIAYDHVSDEEMKEIMAIRNKGKKLKPISEKRKRINEYKKLFR